MANSPEAESVYEVANLFRQRCLIEGRSFLWPDEYVWTKENLRKTWEALSKAEGELESLSSVATALNQQPSAIQMIASDVLAAGCFFPAVKRSTQEKYFSEFQNTFDLPGVDSETWQRLVGIFELEVPGSFTHYKGGKTQNYLSWLFGLMVLVEHDLGKENRDQIVPMIETESANVTGVWNTLIWGLLHTLYPNQFVAVPGNDDRKRILRHFASRLQGHAFDNDFAALDFLRRSLPGPADGGPFDFYDAETLEPWNPQSKHLAGSRRENVPQNDDAATSSEVDPDIRQAGTPQLSDLATSTNLNDSFLREIDELLQEKRQLIFEGPPGSGKTFVAEKFARWFTGQSLDEDEPLNAQAEIVQFHQSYGYEDFVQGIRPETNEHGQLVYKVRDGIFLDLCERALANPEKRFVLIIDEINRGNISRIFGELLLLLEYREKSVRLPYGSGESAYLTIPKNLYLIGTMNSADRSLAQVDYALRRRFYFVRFMPVENGRAEVLESWLATQDVDAVQKQRVLTLFIALNKRIEEELSRDYQVGHSYFMNHGIGSQVGRDRIWTRAIQPLLEEYLHHHRNRDELLAMLHPDHLLASASPPPESEMAEDIDGEAKIMAPDGQADPVPQA